MKVRAWVDVSDPVRDLKKVWQQAVTVDADGDLKKADVDLLTELQAAWQRLLLKGLEDIGAVPRPRRAAGPVRPGPGPGPQGRGRVPRGCPGQAGQPDREAAPRPRRAGHGQRIEEIEFAFRATPPCAPCSPTWACPSPPGTRRSRRIRGEQSWLSARPGRTGRGRGPDHLGHEGCLTGLRRMIDCPGQRGCLPVGTARHQRPGSASPSDAVVMIDISASFLAQGRPGGPVARRTRPN